MHFPQQTPFRNPALQRRESFGVREPDRVPVRDLAEESEDVEAEELPEDLTQDADDQDSLISDSFAEAKRMNQGSRRRYPAR